MMAIFEVKNDNLYQVKDVSIACTLFAKIGTGLGSVQKTIYKIIPTKKSNIFADVNMGFINDQASKSHCTVRNATPHPRTHDPLVVGSNPTGLTNSFKNFRITPQGSVV